MNAFDSSESAMVSEQRQAARVAAASLRIAIDVDHVLADLASLVLPVISEKLGRTVGLSEISRYRVEEALNLTEEKAREIWREVQGRNLYASFPPLDGAVETVNGWVEDEVWVITSRDMTLGALTYLWLRRHRIQFDVLSFTGELSKVTQEQKFDVLVDDHPDVILAASPRVRLGLLIDYPWNRGIRLPDNVRRVETWQQIGQEVTNLRAGLLGSRSPSM